MVIYHHLLIDFVHQLCDIVFMMYVGGKGKKYLKAEAIPSRYLELDNDDGFKVTDLDQTSSPVFILPSISQCSKEECTDIFLKTKILQTENRYIPSLVPNQYYLLSR